jgi:hypothetical protein
MKGYHSDCVKRRRGDKTFMGHESGRIDDGDRPFSGPDEKKF